MYQTGYVSACSDIFVGSGLVIPVRRALPLSSSLYHHTVLLLWETQNVLHLWYFHSMIRNINFLSHVLTKMASVLLKYHLPGIGHTHMSIKSLIDSRKQPMKIQNRKVQNLKTIDGKITTGISFLNKVPKDK